MDVIILGSKSQLAQSIKKISGNVPSLKLEFKTRSQLDVTNPAKLEEFFNTEKFDAIINCAAYTDVDKAEDEKELANEVNHLAVKNLAEISKYYEIKLIHISTDYVFDGTKIEPYDEDDKTLKFQLNSNRMPVSLRTASNQATFYGLTKLAGEVAMQHAAPNNSAIIRTSWLHSEFGGNFVKSILAKSETELKVVIDQTGSPTYADDLAATLLILVKQHQSKGTEIYNYANEGHCTFYQFAKEIIKQSNKQTIITETTTKQLNQKAKRPKYSVLKTDKLKQKYNIHIPNWKDSLKKCLSSLS